jgi:general secretion pathway protein J
MKPTVRSRPGSARDARRPAGFTLIELLVAIGILAVVSVLAWRGLSEVALGRDRLAANMEDERAISQFLDQVRADTRRAAREEVVGGPAVVIAADGFSIVRTASVPGQAPRLQVIRYSLSDGHVVRATSPLLGTVGQLRHALSDGDGDGDGNGDDGGWSSVVLMGGVARLSSRAWIDRAGWTANMADLRNAYAKDLAIPTVPGSLPGPLPRSTTGLQIDVLPSGAPGPLTRLYLLGES